MAEPVPECKVVPEPEPIMKPERTSESGVSKVGARKYPWVSNAGEMAERGVAAHTHAAHAHAAMPAHTHPAHTHPAVSAHAPAMSTPASTPATGERGRAEA